MLNVIVNKNQTNEKYHKSSDDKLDYSFHVRGD